MLRAINSSWFLLLVLILPILLCASAFAQSGSGEPIKALTAFTDLNQQKVLLGERLFHDPRLSADRTISCSSCHALDRGGVDRIPFSVGIKGQVGNINSPTVYNSGYNFVQFWNGRAATLEEQAAGPVHNPMEMGAEWSIVLPRLAKDPTYQRSFKQIYDSMPTGEAVVDAIATFERSLVTLNSPFDQYLQGKSDAISEQAKRGYELFKHLGCSSCHQGAGVGGNLFQVFGAVKSYEHSKIKNPNDLGRYLLTKKEYDRYVFKVPMLRNVAVTPPYFHHGQTKTLEEAVRVMGEFQLGRQLKKVQVDELVAFLRTLTGEYKGKRLE
jgi:cytochrome c peroxidase